mgnify:FL=1|tara:strand:+ start:311 stop:802 length:492 start_codon:yes stop_codon:yes gene_type:complete
MPAISFLGWVHTILGISALLIGFYSLAKYKFIKARNLSGEIYLFATLIVAISSLFIYHQGGFGPAHFMGVLAVAAVVVGFIAEKKKIFGIFSPYIETIAYTSTFLFHVLPAITDGLRRLPPSDPYIDSFEDPLLLNFFLLFTSMYIVGLGIQLILIFRNKHLA